MRFLPTILLILSLPAGALAYAMTVRVLDALLPGQAALTLFVPLFVAGLVMLPFLVPFFDRKAKRDLAEHARSLQSATKDDGGAPEGQHDGQG